MAEGMKIAGNNYFRAAALMLAILGLTFSLLSHEKSLLLVVAYVVTLVYQIMELILIYFAGKVTWVSPKFQAVGELILGALLIIFTIMLLANDKPKDVWNILASVCSFLLASMMAISAYDKFTQRSQ